jgi:Flp pilus assembly protein TadD
MNRWLVCLALVGACRPDDQSTGSIKQDDIRKARTEMPAAAVAQLDSGNAAYRVGDYPRAIQHYQAATRIDSEQAAPWFGLYMAERALGNVAGADSALQRAQKVAPGASLIHPGSESESRPQ